MIEIIKAGVFDSSLIFKNAKITPKRTTSLYELELYISGNGESYIDNVSYPHEKGKMIFSKPGQLRFSKNKFICLYFHLNIDNETAEYLKEIPVATNVMDFDTYKKNFINIFNLYEKNQISHSLLLQSKLYGLLDMIISEKRMKEKTKYITTKISLDTINKSIEFINQNYNKPILLRDIAKSVGYSPIYFHKAFCEYTGKTPHEFLILKRLEKSKIYLLTSDYPISIISEKCGFASFTYFDSNFKKNFNMTPSTFRKRKYLL